MTGAQSLSEDIPARAVRTLGRQGILLVSLEVLDHEFLFGENDSPCSQDDTISGSCGRLSLRTLRYITFAPQLPCMLRAEGGATRHSRS